MNSKANFKHQRIESEIQNILNHTLYHEIYDEELKHASFTAVKLSDDNALATIYVDTFNRDNVDILVDKLNLAKGVFRTALAQSMNRRRIPELKFIRDLSIDNSIKIQKLLEDVKEQ